MYIGQFRTFGCLIKTLSAIGPKMRNCFSKYAKFHLAKLLAVAFITSGHFMLVAQPDYSLMTNWAYHPDKVINLLADYNLDVAVLGPDMEVDSVIGYDNRAIENTGIDVFFVHPTYLEGNYSEPGNVGLDAQPISNILLGIIAQGGLLAQYGRFFAPFYRQATPPTFLGMPDPQAQAEAISVAYGDVRSAFMHYLETHNGGNDFILAAHSQGAYLLSMLLQDVVAGDAELQPRMVAGIPAGMVSVYDTPDNSPGAWWDGLILCGEITQCQCIMTWRSYGENQIPGMNSGHPAYNASLVDSGWVHRVIYPVEDWFYQDSMFYGSVTAPLPYYIAPNGGDIYNTGTGFVAFDSLYSIRYERSGPQQVGFIVGHTPTPDDQRPNDLAAEANDPLYDFWGYHRKDYHIYMWALMEQLNAKLQGCGALGTLHPASTPDKRLLAFPNPTSRWISIHVNGNPLSGRNVEVYNLHGKEIERKMTSETGSLSLEGLPPGLYLLKSELGMMKVVLE